MDRLKYIKLENEDGSYSSSIPLAVDSDHVDVNGSTLTNELNNKANNSNINNLQNQINSLASGSPKGTYTSSDALKADNPDTGVYIAINNGHLYSWNKNSIDDPIDLGVYQATEDSESVELLKNFVKIYDDGLVSISNIATFTNGGLSSGNLVTGQKYRIATNEIITINRDIRLNIADGFKIGVHTFIDGQFSTDSGWKTKSYFISKNTSFKIVIARTSETTSEIANISEFTSKVTFESNQSIRIDECEKATKTVNDISLDTRISVNIINGTTSVNLPAAAKTGQNVINIINNPLKVNGGITLNLDLTVEPTVDTSVTSISGFAIAQFSDSAMTQSTAPVIRFGTSHIEKEITLNENTRYLRVQGGYSKIASSAYTEIFKYTTKITGGALDFTDKSGFINRAKNFISSSYPINITNNLTYAQGGCLIDNKFYFINRNNGIVNVTDIYKGTNQNLVERVSIQDCGHCNDITYNPITKKLYVATMNQNGEVAIINPNTFQTESIVNLKDENDNYIIVYGISYNRKNDTYIIGAENFWGFYIYNSNFEYQSKITLSDTSHYTQQGIETDGNFIYRLLNTTETFLQKYNFDGTLVSEERLDIEGEPEGISYKWDCDFFIINHNVLNTNNSFNYGTVKAIANSNLSGVSAIIDFKLMQFIKKVFEN